MSELQRPGPDPDETTTDSEPLPFTPPGSWNLAELAWEQAQAAYFQARVEGQEAQVAWRAAEAIFQQALLAWVIARRGWDEARKAWEAAREERADAEHAWERAKGAWERAQKFPIPEAYRGDEPAPHRMTIPTSALVPLLLAIDEAVRLAEEGDAAAGYEVLITGRARALEGERSVEPWAEGLEARWDRAVETYAARWEIGRT